jgi:outer membrane protein OmpA-like peptidoglycan-associated protein
MIGRHVVCSVLAIGALAIVGAPALAEDELAPPEGVTIPRTQVSFETVRTFVYPRTQVTIHQDDPQDSDRQELLETFDAEDGPDGTVLTMPDRVLFDFGSAELRTTAEDRLERLLRLLEGAQGAIVVHGHTDDVGDAEANLRLSEDRADAVARHLVEAGIDADRITTEGHGEEDPVEPNTHDDGSDDPEGRQANRRVEIVVELDG